MKNTTVFGVILLIAGVALLVYQSFTYTKREKILEIGPAKIEADTQHTVPIPPIIGWVVLAGGVALTVNGLRQSKA